LVRLFDDNDLKLENRLEAFPEDCVSKLFKNFFLNFFWFA
jgi:hypothetical protein